MATAVCLLLSPGGLPGAALRADEPAPMRRALVLQSDFGTRDGAVAAMKGVAVGVAADLRVYDLTHEIAPFNVWEAGLRLRQAAPYWPAGTVFVSVVDPGVGTARRSVVLRTKNGDLFVGPDNGTLTFVAESLGVDALRVIDETTNRRAGSERSYTFHGRDVYAFTAARLAAGVITFEQVGPAVEPPAVVVLEHRPPRLEEGGLRGTVETLDPTYGNVWSNLDAGWFERLAPAPRVGERFRVLIQHGGQTVYEGTVPYVNSFGDVPVGAPLLYLNSLLQVSLALNQGSFAAAHGVGAGPGWEITVRRPDAPDSSPVR